MRRYQQPEPGCRRQEYVCRLYGIIKDLDRSLRSDCIQGNKSLARKQANPFSPSPTKAAFNRKKDECVCPPGCCQDSLVFKLHRIPNYPGAESAGPGAPRGEAVPDSSRDGGQDSEYDWHKPPHNNGCWCLSGQPRPQPTAEQAMAMGCFVAKAA